MCFWRESVFFVRITCGRTTNTHFRTIFASEHESQMLLAQISPIRLGPAAPLPVLGLLVVFLRFVRTCPLLFLQSYPLSTPRNLCVIESPGIQNWWDTPPPAKQPPMKKPAWKVVVWDTSCQGFSQVPIWSPSWRLLASAFNARPRARH